DSGVRNIFSTYAVGGINPKYRPGDFAIIGQFIDFTWGRNGTFHDKPGSVIHTDMSEPYSKKLSEVLKNSLQQLGQNFYENQVYICTQGPRFETPAEIKAYSIIGADIVGMTGCPEVALAREFGINFASLAVITNLAAGVSTALISHQEVLDIFNARMEIISEVLRLSCLGVSTI
ncbi:MAG TPA: MTAP family purine nucleoside phosphorylase, partial [Caldisericia bacterium]|nr:MTAP family purine nucleoside phosphorylase [Caldisericia bacterium]